MLNQMNHGKMVAATMRQRYVRAVVPSQPHFSLFFFPLPFPLQSTALSHFSVTTLSCFCHFTSLVSRSLLSTLSLSPLLLPSLWALITFPAQDQVCSPKILSDLDIVCSLPDSPDTSKGLLHSPWICQFLPEKLESTDAEVLELHSRNVILVVVVQSFNTLKNPYSIVGTLPGSPTEVCTVPVGDRPTSGAKNMAGPRYHPASVAKDATGARSATIGTCATRAIAAGAAIPTAHWFVFVSTSSADELAG